MPMASRLASVWRTLFAKPRLERELSDELREYVQAVTERKIRSGMAPGAARRAALVEAGGMEQIKEEVRHNRIGSGIELAWLDLRYAWRGLRKSPGFTLAAVLTLALGIGANTAIFSVVHATLIEPLPFRDADRLVFVWTDRSEFGDPRMPMSGPEFNDLRERTTLFEGFGAIWSTTTALTGEGDPEQLRIGLVSADFFGTLGASAALGRTLNAEDETDSAPTGILLGWPLFQRRYGADPAIVGQRIEVAGRMTTVVGVMGPDFRLLMPPDAAVPDDLQAWLLFNRTFIRGPRGQQYLRVVGRMKPGVTVAQAQQEISDIAAQISREFPDYGASGRRFSVVGLQDDGVREMRPALLALLGAVGILLLIACVNVAGLLIARAASRTKETSLRLALGAGRRRLVRQCLAEGLVLAILGGIAGALMGQLVLDLLLALRPEQLGRIETATIDAPVLLFTGGVALVWGLLCSLAPVAELFRADLKSALQEGGRRSGGSVHYRMRAALVTIQLALGVVLIIGSTLMVRTFVRLQQVDPGFQHENILTFRLALPGSRYNTPQAVNEFRRQLRTELARLPGVTGVGSSSHMPYDKIPNWSTGYLSELGADGSLARRADQRAISPGFFEAVGARMVEGRTFSEDDDQDSPLVAIVDETLARRAWPNQSALGRPLIVDPAVTGTPNTQVEVVGVVRHIRHHSLVQEVREQVYLPSKQALRNPMIYVLRSPTDPAALTRGVREIVAKLDPQLPIFDVRPLADYVAGARATQEFTTTLAALFAVLALMLASVGIYGVMAYSVTRRHHEFGVRLALGARPANVLGMVLREGATLAAVGLGIGLAGAAVASRWLEAQLYGVTPWDPASYAVAIPVLVVAVLLACWLPARRATATSPMAALRAE